MPIKQSEDAFRGDNVVHGVRRTRVIDDTHNKCWILLILGTVDLVY